MYKYNLNYLLLSISAPFFFFIGYFSQTIFGWNYDIFYIHSFLIIFTTIFFIILDFIFINSKLNKYIRLISLSILSCSFLGIAIVIIQNDMINTRWLEIGRFSINDAMDYVNQSIQYLFNNEVDTKKGRVIYPILYAGLMGELNLDTNAIQLLLTLLLAVITFFSALIIYKHFGYFYSLIFTGLSVDFLIEHVGGVCTEIIGYILGATAFIFFIKLKLDKIKNIKFLYMFLIFILIGYLIRPSLPLVLPAICIWAFFHINNLKLGKTFSSILVVTSIFSLVFISNKFLLEIKAPNSPKEFGNIYDSWYATHELGKFYREGDYKKLPTTLWTRIIEQNPKLNTLNMTEATDLKKNIFIESLINSPENYIVGSILQIIKFFEVFRGFDEAFHNTAGFLHIEFFGYRALILLLFSLAGIISIYKYIAYKKFNLIFPGLIFLTVIFSQPFIFGGEARTAAPIILFMNFIIIKLIFDTNRTYNLNRGFLKNNNLILQNFCDTNLYIGLTILPFITLCYFFICGLFNNYDYLRDYNKIEISCPKGYQPKQILFNSKSGFFLNSSDKGTLLGQKDFADYYNYMAK